MLARPTFRCRVSPIDRRYTPGLDQVCVASRKICAGDHYGLRIKVCRRGHPLVLEWSPAICAKIKRNADPTSIVSEGIDLGVKDRNLAGPPFVSNRGRT
jgi:hypothetical protein